MSIAHQQLEPSPDGGNLLTFFKVYPAQLDRLVKRHGAQIICCGPLIVLRVVGLSSIAEDIKLPHRRDGLLKFVLCNETGWLLRKTFFSLQRK